jgi:eukaryotic-like serine/threonine-protein kinase
MKPEQWKEIERLYQASIELQPDRRTRFLAEACADIEIRREVESLLASRDQGPSFLERAGVDVAADIINRNHTEPLIGRTIGHYQVLSLIGAGGMGVVYRARDTRLGRDVALKVLPEEFSRDRDSVVRSEREAKLLASLNHPNIAGVYDLEESEAIRCLVLELVEGETLAERLRRWRIPVAEALVICRQIVEALEAAHEVGIVHRDLKPGNVMITPGGAVKVLDFGIAKRMATDASPSSQASVDALSLGVVLGTPSYMSPEQARGKPADKRTDIWAFGCVLYEALTGRRAFEKETVTDTLAAIIEREPDWSALPRATPARVEDLLRRCLHKDPRWRLRDIGDARIEIASDQNQPQRDIPVVERHVPSKRLVWISSIALLALIAGLLAMWRLRPEPPLPEIRLEITTPPSADPVSLAISPDGQKLVFVATHEGRSRLWLRSLGSISTRPLEGTDGASCPFWSPNNGSVGFFADGKLKRVDVDSGSVRELTAALACGGTWNADDTILYSLPMFGPISRVSATGGGPALPTRVDVTRTDRPRHTRHRFPQFLPDGHHFLYYAAGSPEARGIYVGDLNGSEPRRLLDADTAAVYVSSGHLVFVRQGTLFGQAFDPVGMVLTGNPFPVDDRVAFDPTKYAAAVSASSTGIVIYRTGSAAGRRQFLWLDRSGKEIGRVGDPDSADSLDPSLSPDGHRAALHRTVNGRPDIWLLETGRAALSRFTSEEITGAAGAIRPIWSPDGTQIVFASIAKEVTDLFRMSVSGGNAELLLETDQPKAATDWSTDGRFLLYRSSDPKTGWDIWALPMDGGGRPETRVQVVRTNFDEMNGQLSPDGKWVAYQSNETGRFEIYVQPFPGPGPKSAVSRNGGAQVRWRRDGKELFYVALDDRLMAVPMRFVSNGQSIEVGAPTVLFTTRIGGAARGADRHQYMVSSDGQRFLMNTIMEEAISPIIVLLNWKASP